MKICININCNKEFEPYRGQKYCSKKCCQNIHDKRRKPENMVKYRLNKKTKYKNRMVEIHELLGNHCANPYNIDHSGFEVFNLYHKILQIDHINGGGCKERKKFKGYPAKYYEIILKELKAGSKDYQLLCPTCNWIKQYINKERNNTI
jgi:hypothetical protein